MNRQTPHRAAPNPGRRRALSWLAAGAATATTARPVLAAQQRWPIVIEFSHVVKADATKGRAVQRFKELAEARTQGRVRVNVYPDSQLYKDREEIDALRIGAVQMLAPSLSKLSSVGGNDFEVFDLPFLFKDHAAFRAVVDGPVGRTLLAKLEPSDIKGLGYWDNGFKVFTANRPLITPNDFRGLKVRVQSSRILVEEMKALGADVSVLPLANVFEDLRTGKLDGEENVPVNIYTQHLHEVQTDLTLSQHGYLAYAVLVNKPFWDRLPADIRVQLQLALKEATQFANSIAEQENARALERLKADSRLTVHALSERQLQEWQRAMTPVYQLARKHISPDILAGVQAATGMVLP